MPKINDKTRQENKAVIAEIAAGLFYKHGYNKTSVSDIIGKAKISKGKFYTYYLSKEDLFFDVIHTSDQEIRESHQEFHLLDDYIEYRLKRFLHEHNRVRAKYSLEFWSSSSLSGVQQDKLNERYDNFRNDIKSIVVMGKEKGIYKEDVPIETLIHILMATIDGLIMMDTVLKQRISEDRIKTTIDIFNTYLKGDK